MKLPGARRWLARAAIVAAAIASTGLAGGQALSRYAERRATAILHRAYGGQLQVNSLTIRVFPGVYIEAGGVTLEQHDHPDLPPFLSAKHVSAEANLLGMFRHPVHVSFARLEGLEIHVPPRGRGTPRKIDVPEFVIDELRADHSSLQILPRNADKQPLEFEIRELTINDAGAAAPMKFRTILINAKPPGEIHSTGKFGPLQLDDPATSQVEGSYTFQNADLSVFAGIAGTLSSAGTYQGTLDDIGVQGKTDTPNFTVLLSGNPVRLTTQFQAVVDGMNGDTWLNQINGQLGRTALTVKGSVDGTRGVPGKRISLDVTISQGRLEDLLLLGVKGPSPMTGAISIHSTIIIPPGPINIPEKLRLDGQFKADEAHFKAVNVQARVDKLSDRGRGDPREDGGDVASNFQGKFDLSDSVMKFDSLSFDVPGVQVALHGSYDLLNENLDMHGTASLEAKLSETVTGFKSFLLKAVDPLFERKGKGAVVPIRIEGTPAAPRFGLDAGKILKK